MQHNKLWQLYHLNSRVKPAPKSSNFKVSIHCQKSDTFKNFQSWSLREQSNSNISFLSELLISSYSVKSISPYRRTAPSAGAIYPIDIYFSLNIKNEPIPNGLYFYSIDEAKIYLIKNYNHKNTPHLFLQEELKDTKIMIYFVANFMDVDDKYDERSYRYILLEAGHIAQNFNMQAERLGSKYRNIGGYSEERINSLLNLNALDSGCIYCLGIF